VPQTGVTVKYRHSLAFRHTAVFSHILNLTFLSEHLIVSSSFVIFP
jgi:hypothetical protein